MREAVIEKGRKLEQEWNQLFNEWRENHPDLAKEWDQAFNNELLDNLEDIVPKFEVGEKLATRAASGKTINALAQAIPYLVGGSADLAPSNNTLSMMAVILKLVIFQAVTLTLV